MANQRKRKMLTTRNIGQGHCSSDQSFQYSIQGTREINDFKSQLLHIIICIFCNNSSVLAVSCSNGTTLANDNKKNEYQSKILNKHFNIFLAKISHFASLPALSCICAATKPIIIQLLQSLAAASFSYLSLSLLCSI
jgi:hypothetical protein